MANFKRKKRGKKYYDGWRTSPDGERFSNYNRRIAAEEEINPRVRPAKSKKKSRGRFFITAHCPWLGTFTWKRYPDRKNAEKALASLRRSRKFWTFDIGEDDA